MTAPGRTHCKHGHELTDKTLRRNTKGAVYCSVCAAAASKRNRRKADPESGTRKDKYSPSRLSVTDAVCKRGHAVTSDTVVTYANGHRRCRECVRENGQNQRLKKYGVSHEQYADLLAAQDGRCAICGDVMGGGRNEHIDHDHMTGVVRGLLCTHCNTAIGKFRDDPERLMKAAVYLRQFAETAV